MRKLIWFFVVPALLISGLAFGQVQRTQEVGIGGALNREVLVLNTATYVPGGATHTPLANRRSILLQNLGPQPIYCTIDGQAPLATGALGIRILPGESWSPSVATVAVRCISSASQLTTAATQVVEVR
jgi:hypothetical protein